MDARLKEIAEQIRAAEKAQIDRLKHLYPLGTYWGFHIQHGQVNESTGKVIGYRASVYGGYVVIRHDQAKPGSRYANREVHPDSITRRI